MTYHGRVHDETRDGPLIVVVQTPLLSYAPTVTILDEVLSVG